MAKRASNTEPTFDNLVEEFRALVDSMEDVLSAVTGNSSEKLMELKGGKAEASLRKAKATLGGMERTAVAKARRIASDSDGYVHENPWTIGIGAGIGFLLGVLIGRK